MKIKAVPVFQHFRGRIVSLQHAKSDKCFYQTSSCQHLKPTKLTFCLVLNKSTGTTTLELRGSMRSMSIDSADCQSQFWVFCHFNDKKSLIILYSPTAEQEKSKMFCPRKRTVSAFHKDWPVAPINLQKIFVHFPSPAFPCWETKTRDYD